MISRTALDSASRYEVRCYSGHSVQQQRRLAGAGIRLPEEDHLPRPAREDEDVARTVVLRGVYIGTTFHIFEQCYALH